jgi:hypothetical protein
MNTIYEIVNGVIGNADVSVTFASLYITMHKSFTQDIETESSSSVATCSGSSPQYLEWARVAQ